MANRYWVGGSASWDGTAGTKWSSTSGGAGGASVPTSADDVFFTSSSTGTVTIASGNTGAKSINCTGFTGTLTGTAAISVAGSVTLVSGMTYSHTGTMTFTATGTLITAGKSFSAVTVNGSGITLTLGDALSMATARSVTVTQGTFTTANFNLSCGNLISTGTSTRTINLGSSTVAIGTNLTFDATNLTLNAGTSLIQMLSSAAIFAGGDKSFNNVTFTSASTGTRSITGSNTFNNLTLGAGGVGRTTLSLAANQTVNGTFACAGSSVTQRAFIISNVIGTVRTVTAAAISASDCDFRDITLAGAAAGASPTRAGNCGGNSGITFPAAKTVYRVGTDTTWAGSSSWATSSGGTGSNNNFPLPQDTAIINNATTLSGTLSLALYNIGSLDASSRTNAITISNTTGCDFYGSFTLGSGVTFSGTAGMGFSGRGTMVFTSAGKTITGPVEINTPSGTLQLGSAFTSNSTSGSPGPIQLTSGTFDAATYNVTTPRFRSDNSNTRTLLMGSGLWTLTGTGTGSTSIWNVGSTNLTVNKGTADILLSDTSTSHRQMWVGDGLSFNKLTIGGTTGTTDLYLFGSNFSFTELASTKTVAHTVMFSGNLGTIGTWSISGSAGNLVIINSSSPGTRRTFTLTNPTTSSINYLNITDIGVTDPNRFYVGPNSTNGGNNLNVIFSYPGGGATSGNMFLMF